MTNMAAKDTPEAHHYLYIYMVAWSIHRLYEVAGAGNQTLGWHGISQLAIVPLTVAAIVTGNIRLWIWSMFATAAANFSLMPFIWDSEYWCLLTDFAVVYSATVTLGWRRLLFGGDNVSEATAELRDFYQTLRSTIMRQMIVFYSAAFFWKLTWDFLDPHSSCAPVFAMQLLDHVVWWTDIPQSILWAIGQLSPVLVLLVEGNIVLLFLTRPRYGVLLAMVLHVGIAMCPPPSNVATFSIMCASRLVLFVPKGTWSATRWEAWSTMELIGTVVITSIVAKIADHDDFYDMAYPLFTFFTPFVVKAALLEPDGAQAPLSSRARPQVLPLSLAIFYAYCCITLGIMDQGQPHMYANLRLHGGSNHILGVPTGLLQHWFENATSSVFQGGIVRIESSTLSSLNEIYPGDYTMQMTERSRRFMLAAGHSSRNFNPMLTAVTSSEAPWNEETPFVQYTMPAHELRRILQVAREENNESFTLHYTQLFGSGDEKWRATAPGHSVRLEEIVDRTGDRHIKCRVVGGGACESSVDIPLWGPLPFWARKLLLFEPYPIIPGDFKLHCFGP